MAEAEARGKGGGALCCTWASCVWRILTCLVRVSSNNEAHAISLLIQSNEDGKSIDRLISNYDLRTKIMCKKQPVLFPSETSDPKSPTIF
jgi:hypothetical protein